VTFLDLFIAVAALSAVAAGYRLGFLARAISWLGLALGLTLAALALPRILEAFSDAGEVQLFFAAVGILIAGALVGQAIGLVIGRRARVAIPAGPARTADQVAGSMAGVLGVLVAVWLLLPTMATVPGWPSEQARNSTVADAIVDVFPEAPDTFRALRHIIGDDRFPQVFAALQPAPDLGDPPASTGIAPDVSDRVAQSAVRLESQACGRIQEGSGFVVDDGLVVTNAHVLAGATDTEVVRTDGVRLAGTVVGFDPDRDLAAVRVSELNRAPLPIASPRIGDVGGVYGFPGGGPLRIAPYEIARRVRATGNDIYDQDRIEREVFFLSAALRAGDSGSALVDPAGQVVGVAFAVAPDRSGVGYALTETEVNAFMTRDLSGPVGTGPCIG
jgi:S1-C subfamily serine protease